jgi:hypothetical protein
LSSSAQLDALVAEAQRVVRGVEPQQLRDRDALRRSVAAQLGRVRDQLDAMLVAGRVASAADHPSGHGNGGPLMKLRVTPDDLVGAVYDEAIDLAELGQHIEELGAHGSRRSATNDTSEHEWLVVSPSSRDRNNARVCGAWNDLLAHDRHLAWCPDAEPDLISVDPDDRHDDVSVDHNLLADLPGED